MGIAGSHDIFQAKMTELMSTLEFVRAYIDYLLCTTKGTLEDHLAKLDLVLSRLQDANLKVNARKSNFCATETEYLGYILSRDGIKTTTQEGTVDTCTDTAQKCQRPP